MTLPVLTSPPGEDPVHLEGFFAAPPERVFRAWADPKAMGKWFGPGNSPKTFEADVRPGGWWRARFQRDDGAEDTLKGEYFEIQPNEKIVFSWIHERKTPDGVVEATKESRVTVSFSSAEGGTRLSLLHEGILTEDARKGVGGGWGGAMQVLDAFLSEEE